MGTGLRAVRGGWRGFENRGDEDFERGTSDLRPGSHQFKSYSTFHHVVRNI